MQLILQRAVGDIRGQLRNIRSLVADALHIRDEFERGRNTAQVTGHGLLAEKKAHAVGFDFPFQLVDFCFQSKYLLRIRAGFAQERLRSHGAFLRERYGAESRIIPFSPLPISSTQIRARVRGGQSLEGLVPPQVAPYIQINRLYRD